MKTFLQMLLLYVIVILYWITRKLQKRQFQSSATSLESFAESIKIIRYDKFYELKTPKS